MSRSTNRPRRLRRLALSALAATAAVAGTLATSIPAQATYYGQVTGCFQMPINYAGGLVQWYPAPNTPVYVDYFNGSRIVRWKSVSTGSNGCVTVTVPAGYPWAMEMDYYTGYNSYGWRFHYAGMTNWAAVGGPYSYNLGTSRVSAYQVR